MILREFLEEESGRFWWMRWRGVGYGSLHARHVRSDVSCDTAALLFWRVLPYPFLGTTLHIVGWQA